MKMYLKLYKYFIFVNWIIILHHFYREMYLTYRFFFCKICSIVHLFQISYSNWVSENKKFKFKWNNG